MSSAQKKALSFIENYATQANKILKDYLLRKKKEVRRMGEIPRLAIERFENLALRGKKLRGALTVLGYQMCGGEELSKIIPASLFIELFHTGILIHDDFMDRDHLRRGLPTMHLQFAEEGKKREFSRERSKHYGDSMAICIGDLAFYLSWEILLESNFPPERLLKAGRVFASYITRLVHGQILDISMSPQQFPSKRKVMLVFRYKTAEYTGVLPLLIGAILAGEDDKKRLDALAKFGLCLGWAFQIRDDLLGMFGDEATLGKPIGSDLREGKMTLLMLHLHERGGEKERIFQRKILGSEKITKEEIHKMQKILERSGSKDYVEELGKEYIKEARRILRLLTDKEEIKEILSGILSYIMVRKK